MKKSIIAVSVAVVISLIMPVLSAKKPNEKNKTSDEITKTKAVSTADYKNEDTFKLKITEKNKIIKLSASDYVFGCVAGEMPINYHDEALKAQCVAAYTYALRKKENSKQNYDLTDSFLTDQCYLSDDKIKEKWGENYGENREKLESIISRVIGYKLTYKGQTALSVYHAISNGKTLSAKEVWGEDIPYLCSVDSSFDRLSESYKTTVSVGVKDFLSFYKKVSGEKISDIKSLKTEKTKNGKTAWLYILNTKTEAEKIVEEYSLRSSCFDAVIEDDRIVFSVFGYGHGVGMSQNGANQMAKSGSTFKEILLHYYKGCKLERN